VEREEREIGEGEAKNPIKALRHLIADEREGGRSREIARERERERKVY